MASINENSIKVECSSVFIVTKIDYQLMISDVVINITGDLPFLNNSLCECILHVHQ